MYIIDSFFKIRVFVCALFYWKEEMYWSLIILYVVLELKFITFGQKKDSAKGKYEKKTANLIIIFLVSLVRRERDYFLFLKQKWEDWKLFGKTRRKTCICVRERDRVYNCVHAMNPLKSSGAGGCIYSGHPGKKLKVIFIIISLLRAKNIFV